jgi:RimJ/RimL family protein N-acetyltransferase
MYAAMKPDSAASYRETAWTAERIRETERGLAADGAQERMVVAVDADTGHVVGVTGVLRYPHRQEFVYQNDTSVLAEHRGHGLGLAMKAAMMRWITADWPEVERVYTTTAVTNTYMIKVNHALGYQSSREMIWVEAETEHLAEALNSLAAAP